MPELPEVETMRRDLARELTGAVLSGVRVRAPDIIMDGLRPRTFAGRLRARRITAVERRGKNLLFRFDGGVLLAQVRMTGRFSIAGSDDPRGKRLRREIGFRHVAAEFELADGRTVLYDDVRRLGGFVLLTPEEWQRRESRIGPEPLAPRFRSRDLAAGLGAGRIPVKNALLDQRRVAGVGNIYASEALHEAGIDPRRPVGSLEPRDVQRLHRSVRSVLRSALASSGTSLRDYRMVNGQSGRFQERLRVYDRETEPCQRCGVPIARIVQSGRSTYFCPSCQT